MYEDYYHFSAKPFQLNPDPRFFFGSKGHKRAMAYLDCSLPSDIQAYIVNDLQMTKIDFEDWCTRYALIVDDKGRNVPLVPWPSQRALLDVLAREEEKAWDYYVESSERELMAKIALILLKSRQIGGTVISEALLTHLVTLFSHTRIVIAIDHPDNTLKLFRVLTNMIDSLPPWMKPIQDARVKANNLHFSELDSDVVAGAGNQKTTLGQGMTIDAPHLTELSTWDPGNADAVDADLKPAFNSSRKHHL